VRTGDDDLEFVWGVVDPRQPLGQFLWCPIVGRIPCVDQHVTIGDMAYEVVVVCVRNTDNANAATRLAMAITVQGENLRKRSLSLLCRSGYIPMYVVF
jgi:hypothetical protein